MRALLYVNQSHANNFNLQQINYMNHYTASCKPRVQRYIIYCSHGQYSVYLLQTTAK